MYLLDIMSNSPMDPSIVKCKGALNPEDWLFASHPTQWEQVEALCVAAHAELTKDENLVKANSGDIVHRYICEIEIVLGNPKPRSEILWMESIWIKHMPGDCTKLSGYMCYFMDMAVEYTTILIHAMYTDMRELY
jgi:hypothetical protein